MLTNKDLASLRRHESQVGKIIEWLVILSPIVVVIVANLYLQRAVLLSAQGDEPFSQVPLTWLRGFDARESYSGIFVSAVEDFRTAVILAMWAVAFAGIAWLYIATQRMNERIVETLEDHGALGDGEVVAEDAVAEGQASGEPA